MPRLGESINFRWGRRACPVSTLMTLWNNQYRIETARRKGHDYRSAGWYHITICTQNKVCAFGHVLDCQTVPSLAGKIVSECWQEIPKHYPGVELDEFGLMPNHVHGIVVLQGITNGPSLGNVVGSFKSAASRECGQAGLETYEWQPRFHDRILRGEKAIGAVRLYIQLNPANWEQDEFYVAS